MMSISKNFYQSFIALFLLSAICLGQISSGGSISGAGLMGGGRADTILKKEVTSVFDKRIFSGLGQKTAKAGSSSKKVIAKKGSPKPKSAPIKTQKSVPAPMTTFNLGEQTALNFQPQGDTGLDQELTDMLAQQDDHKAVLLAIFRETKKAYNVEARRLGHENDIALATTFFIAACISVYHESPDPTDEATNALYETLANSMLETPAIIQLSNQEKQLVSDKMIYLGGLILSGYLISKQGGDYQTMQTYRQIAATCFQAFTNLNVTDFQFSPTGLKLKS